MIDGDRRHFPSAKDPTAPGASEARLPPSPEDRLEVYGRSRMMLLRQGLSLQVIDADYHEDIAVRYVKPPGFGIYLHFAGSDGLDVSVEGHPLPIGRHGDVDESPFGFALCRRSPTLFTRTGRRGTRLSCVIVWLSFEWLDQTVGARNGSLPPGSRDHLAISRWFPSQRLISLARRLFDEAPNASATSRLRYEIVSLEMVAEALATMRSPLARRGNRGETLALNKACDAIEADLAGDLSIEHLAGETGVSVKALRRAFREAYGCTVSDYVRTRRLDAARDMLENGCAVSAAAIFAGYTSQANFATAFRRRFGMTPRQARNGDA